ncbi:MAG: hypothetical protein JW768_01880 [Chitinispirillaceae bacterium]|nr:hypothetical protein [Chitinispirillaceae bacterium]
MGIPAFAATFFAGAVLIVQAVSCSCNECENWQNSHPAWIFCDDFESDDPLVTTGRYFEYGDNDGDFKVVQGVGLGNSKGMEAVWQQGEVEAGGMKLAFGRNPNSYMNKQQISRTRDFREIYYRMYLKMQDGWEGSPAKLSRATVFTSAGDWRQAMIAHLWSDNNCRLLLDPASCVNASGVVECTTYNDFDNLNWLGNQSGRTPLFDTAHDDTWFCIEHHVRLNDPGETNGVQEFWINDSLEARRENLNFTGTYNEYAINAVFFENYWNDGSPKEQKRYFDNIVVSTERIGCCDSTVQIIPHKHPVYTYPGTGALLIRTEPFTGTVRIVYHAAGAAIQRPVRIQVYDLKGAMAHTYKADTEQLLQGYAVPAQGLSDGVYLIRVTIEGSAVCSAFLKVF